MIATPDIDKLTNLLHHVAGYYNAAPVVWWTMVGLSVLGIVGWTLRGIFGRKGEK